MAVGDTTGDSLLWFPGEPQGKDLYGALVDIPSYIDAATKVTVLLGSDGFDIVPSESSVPAGNVEFTVTDVGTGHELLVIKTDVTASGIIADAPIGGQFDESAYDIRLDTGEIPHGKSGKYNVSLSSGAHVLVCNSDGHAHSGMAIDWLVD